MLFGEWSIVCMPSNPPPIINPEDGWGDWGQQRSMDRLRAHKVDPDKNMDSEGVCEQVRSTAR